MEPYININTRTRRRERLAPSASEKEDTGPAESVTDSGSETSGWRTASLTRERRGRGRPPTTGEYLGMARAKEALNKAKKEELRLQAEEEVAEEIQRTREATRAFFLKARATPEVDVEECHTAELQQLVAQSADMIVKVATKSSNLKGTYVKSLKDAARTMKASFETVRARTMSAEVALWVKANQDLTEEVARLRTMSDKVDLLEKANHDLTEEVAKLRREKEEAEAARSQIAPIPVLTAKTTPAPQLEEVLREFMAQVDSRLEAIEERWTLRGRQPSIAERSVEQSQPVQEQPIVGSAPATLTEPRASARRERKRHATDKQQKNVRSVSPAAPAEPALGPASSQEAWTTVVRKKPRKKNAAQKSTQLLPAKAKVAKLRPPRTAAVVISLQPCAEGRGVTYAKVLAAAKEQIDLGALAVPPLKIRATVTGARLLEVSGEDRSEKADALARKLQEVVQEMEGVTVSRPVATTDLMVSGLDDSVQPQELLAALTKAGNCSAAGFRVGEVRRGRSGMGTSFVRCPIAAAKAIAKSGRLRVGWVSARVQILDPRPRRCHRCLNQGHIRAQCKTEVDRSDECYRCGQKGHKASACSAAPHCTLCAAANQPANHLLGGKTCAKSSLMAKQKGRPAHTAGPARASKDCAKD